MNTKKLSLAHLYQLRTYIKNPTGQSEKLHASLLKWITEAIQNIERGQFKFILSGSLRLAHLRQLAICIHQQDQYYKLKNQYYERHVDLTEWIAEKIKTYSWADPQKEDDFTYQKDDFTYQKETQNAN